MGDKSGIAFSKIVSLVSCWLKSVNVSIHCQRSHKKYYAGLLSLCLATLILFSVLSDFAGLVKNRRRRLERAAPTSRLKTLL